MFLNQELKKLLGTFYFPEKVKDFDKTYQKIFSEKGARKALSIVKDINNRILREHQAKFAYFSIGGADGSEVDYVMRNTPISCAVMIEYNAFFASKAKKRSDALQKENKIFVVVKGDAMQNLDEALGYLKDWRRERLVNGIIVSAQSVLHELPRRSPGFDMSVFFGKIFCDWDNILFYSREPCRTQTWPENVLLKLRNIPAETLAAVAKHIKAHLDFQGSVTVVAGDFVHMPSDLALETLFKVFYFSTSDFRYEMGEQLTSIEPEKIRSQLETYLGENTVRLDYTVSDRFEKEYRRLVDKVRNPKTGEPLRMPFSFAVFVGQRIIRSLSQEIEKPDNLKLDYKLPEPNKTDRIISITDLGQAIDYEIFKGRRREIEKIRAWLNQPPPRGWVIHGFPGQGKTELARRYGIESQQMTFQNIVGVSFKHSDTAEQIIERIASTLFRSVPNRTNDQVAWILRFCQANELLLIIDGLESEQDPGSTPPGMVSQGPFQDLLYELMGPKSKVRLLITSRLKVSGIDPIARIKSGGELNGLSPKEGKELLRALGASGTDETLENVSEILEGHPFSLTLAPKILRKFGEDDLERLIKNISEDERVEKLLLWYKTAMSKEALTLIRIIAACDRPISEKALNLLLTKKCTRPLRRYSLSAAMDECANLLWTDKQGRLDVHPIVRGVFQQEWLSADQKQAKAAHGLLADFYTSRAKNMVKRDKPTLPDLEPAFAAIHHRVMRGEVHKAIQINDQLVDQDPKMYLVRKLGAWGAYRDILLKIYFRDRDWNKPLENAPTAVAMRLSNLARALINLGNTNEAVEILDRARDMIVKAAEENPKDRRLWGFAFTASENYVEVMGALGQLEEAYEETDRLMEFAEKTPDVPIPFSGRKDLVFYVRSWKALALQYRARTKFWCGDFQAALSDFEMASEIQKAVDPNHPSWYFDFGRKYVELLLLIDKNRNWQLAKSAHAENFEFCRESEFHQELLALQIEEAMLARISGDQTNARNHLDSAYYGVQGSEIAALRVAYDLELARYQLCFGSRENAMECANRALNLAERKGLMLLQCDSLTLVAEAEQSDTERQKHIAKGTEIVDVLGYGRRRGDLELLREGKRPVKELGL